MNNFKFTFEKESDYESARRTGYIDLFDIVRIKVSYEGGSIDYPVKSREEFENELANVPLRNGEIVEMYQDQHYYDIADYE
jgi:hypothetical protein